MIKIVSYLFPLLLILSACAGQTGTEKRSPASSPAESTPVDRLFFIEGQLCQHLREIFQDSRGNLWFGTNVYDLMRYDGDSLQYIGPKDGFSGGRVTSITEDKNGHIWIGTARGLNRYDGTSFRVFAQADGLQNSEIWCIWIDQQDVIWIGHNEGLARFDGQQFTNISIPKPPVANPETVYAPDRIIAIAEDSTGNLWLGTDGYGICRYDRQTFTHFTEENGLGDNAIYDLFVDRKGQLWIGTFWGGVSRFNGETFQNFTQDGLIQGVEAGGFFEDTNGDIWFGVENNGVYRYDGNTFHHYSSEAVWNASILSIYRDRENRFWLGGWGGLFRFLDGRFTPVSRQGPWY